MFERVGKDNSVVEPQNTKDKEPDRAAGSVRSPVTSRGGDPAVIGRSIQINGDLRGGEDLRIEGDVSGTVELRNNALTIGKEGKVKADVYAKSIAVDGETKGDLYATERVSIHVNARVQGNIIAPRVGIEEGAHFKGSIEMDPAAVENALGKTRPGAASKPAADKPSSDAATKPAVDKSNSDAATKPAVDKSNSDAATKPAASKSSSDTAAKVRPRHSGKGADTGRNAPPANA